MLLAHRIQLRPTPEQADYLARACGSCRHCYNQLLEHFSQTADLSPPEPTPQLCFLKSACVPHVFGCNSSFRRSALLEIGSFDEEFEYFLDETDVCVRIADAGYLIVQLPDAFVHHKFPASAVRGGNQVVWHRYPIIKNKLYFMLKHARAFHPRERIVRERAAFAREQEYEVASAVRRILLTRAAALAFAADLPRALSDGWASGGGRVRILMPASMPANWNAIGVLSSCCRGSAVQRP